MDKEQFKNFVNETKDYPYFSAIYDMDMWKEDYKEIEKLIEEHQTPIMNGTETTDVEWMKLQPKTYSIIGDTFDENYYKATDMKLNETHSEIKLQTNRQWLESLSDEELAKYINGTPCDSCIYETQDVCQHRLNDCDGGIFKWLQAKHKE